MFEDPKAGQCLQSSLREVENASWARPGHLWSLDFFYEDGEEGRGCLEDFMKESAMKRFNRICLAAVGRRTTGSTQKGKEVLKTQKFVGETLVFCTGELLVYMARRLGIYFNSLLRVNIWSILMKYLYHSWRIYLKSIYWIKVRKLKGSINKILLKWTIRVLEILSYLSRFRLSPLQTWNSSFLNSKYISMVHFQDSIWFELWTLLN